MTMRCGRMTIAAAAAAALLVSTGGPSLARAAARPAPVPVYLQPIGDGVVEGLAVEKVERTLRERLGRKKSIVLVTEPEQATITLKVTQCAGWGEKRRVSEAGDRIFFRPGSETSYGVRTENRTHVLLVVHATWGERFAELASHDGDRTLKAATDSVVDEVERLARRN